MNTFGAQVRSARVAAGRSQRRLAADLNIDHGYLSRIESGSRLCSPEMVDALANALELPGHVRALASFEMLASYHGVCVQDVVVDAAKASAELAANPDVDHVLSGMGVMVMRECTSDCCCHHTHAAA